MNKVEKLKNKNKELVDELFRVKELLRKQKKILDGYKNGFHVSTDEWGTIRKWQKEHEKMVHNIKIDEDRMNFGGAIGGTYTYEFIPTSLGILGSVKCSCGEKFVFSDIF